MLLCTLVLSQLDCVNSMLSRAPTTTVKPYQTTQNFAARVASKKSKREDVYTCLQELHWLPIKYKNHIQVTKNSLQCSPKKSIQISQGKLKQKHFPRIIRHSTSSSITLDILFNRKNHLLTGVLVMLWHNTGMTFQNTSEMQKTSKFQSLAQNTLFKTSISFTITAQHHFFFKTYIAKLFCKTL